MKEQEATLTETTEKMIEQEATLTKTKDNLHEEKAKRHRILTEEESKRKKLMEEIHKLNEWTLELDEERKAAEKKECTMLKKFVRAHEAAFERLQKLKRENESRRTKEDELINAMKALSRTEHELDITKNLLEKSNKKKLRMKKEWSNLSNSQSRKEAGCPSWPTWVVLMICKLLISGTAPTAVPSIVQIIY
jgi:hypothetical protein